MPDNKCKRHGCNRPAKRVFCTAECRVDHIAATRPRAAKQTKTCQQCGVEFIASRSHQKVCSDKCRVYLHRGAPKAIKAKARPSVRRPETGLKVADLDTRWNALSARQKAQLLGQIEN